MHPATIGPFQIERELGRGGMGEVYLALDTKLERRVAIKALPEHLAAAPDALARFQREAKVLASLNHPNIAAIHGLDEAQGRRYLVLEFVEGETLADRLGRGTIPVEEALPIAKQVAEALEAAHEKGIIHRDLKPGNVMVTPEGKVKVLDFGLARTVEGNPSSTHAAPDSPTLRGPHSPTIPGAIMGTAGYMSPEQARGKAVDKRSDIFSFGCVLYEMLSGRGPFPGETVTDSLGAILHREPEWSLLPPGTPALVQVLLRRCLVKDRKRRLQDIGDARVELDAAIEDPAGTGLLLGGTGGGSGVDGHSSRGVRRRWSAIAATTLVLGGVIGWLVAGKETPPAAPPVVRFDIELPSGYKLPSLGEGFAPLCLSPAGDKVVFGAEAEGTRQLFVRDLSEAEAKPLPGAKGAAGPFFSPDGRWLGFFADDQLKKVPIAGGPAVTICEAHRSSACWASDGTIVFGRVDGVVRVSDKGGVPELLAPAGPTVRTADGQVLVLGVNHVDAVPGAPYVLASVWDGDTLQSYWVVAVALKDGAMRPVMKNATDVRFIAPDRLVFLRESALMAVPFDPARGVVTGEAVQVVDAVRSTRWADAAYWAASPGGALAYVPGGRMGPGRRLIRVDAAGKSTPLMDGLDAIVGGMRVSPDGKSVALVTLRQRVELWVYDPERRSMSLVNAEGESWQPVWTPDSTALIFTRVVPGRHQEIVRKAIHAGAGSPAELIRISSEGEFYPSSMTPDGGVLLMIKEPTASDLKQRIVMYRMNRSEVQDAAAPSGGGGTVEMVPGSGADEAMPRLSPDGKLLAFMSDESGRYEVYLRAMGGQGPRLQVSTAGGNNECWSHDGKRLYFLDRKDVLHAAEIDTGEGLRVSAPTRLFGLAGVATTSLWGTFDALPDGSFVMVEPAAWETQPARIRVVLNWAEELRGQTAPEPKR